MSAPDRTVKKATHVSTSVYARSCARVLTNTEHEWYVANATLGSRDIVHRLKVEWEIVEQKEKGASGALITISNA